MPRNTKLSPLAQIAVAAIEDVKGQNITILDVQSLTTVTDTMIVCTGTSNRHAKSLAQSVVEKAKEAGHRPLGVEGMDQGDWVLVDLGGVVVHAMQAQARAFYQLEKLWAMAEPVSPETQTRKSRNAATGMKKAPSKSAAKSAAKKKTPTGKAAKKPMGKKPASKATPKPSAKPAATRKVVKKAVKKAASARAKR